MALKEIDVLPIDHINASADFARAHYHVVIPKRFSWEHCLLPEFYRHQTKLQPNDLLDLVAEDGSFDCTVRVTACSRGFAVLRVLREYHAPQEAVVGEVGRATIGFVPPLASWCLFDASGAPVAKFATEDSAKAALDEHLAANPPAPAEAA
jgi:hypothetical protein